MKTIYRLLITRILFWLHGLTAADFDKAKQFVLFAENNFSTPAQKWAFVKQKMQALLPLLSATAVNLLIELAVSFLKKKA